MSKYLIWGGRGWIGSKVVQMLQDQGHEVILASSRLQDYIGLCKEISSIKPDFVINCAGLTGVPNIDALEERKQDTMLMNVSGTINLADACFRYGVHLTNFASGCIYTYTNEKPVGTKFTEEDEPNFYGSTYSVSKIHAQQVLSYYPNVLTLRLRMPISDTLDPKNFITKISKYAKLINVPNSMTVLTELLPISIKMSQAKLTGIYNFVNRGTISHNQILEMYRKYIDPTFTWTNFTEEEQNQVLKAKRSNCELCTEKLETFHPVSHIYDAVEDVFRRMSS